MALNFPDNPTNGETYTASNGVTYTYDISTDTWTGSSAAGDNYWEENDQGDLYPKDINASVGIGTGAPQANLEVAGSGGGMISITNTDDGSLNAGTFLQYRRDGDRAAYVGYPGSGNSFFVTNEVNGGSVRLASRQNDGTLNGSALVVDGPSGGNVGIATNNPQERLSIVGTNSGLTIASAGQEENLYHIFRAGNNGHLVFTGSQEKFSGYDFQVYPEGGSINTTALFIED